MNRIQIIEKIIPLAIVGGVGAYLIMQLFKPEPAKISIEVA
jgi:hypothetical protein